MIEFQRTLRIGNIAEAMLRSLILARNVYIIVVDSGFHPRTSIRPGFLLEGWWNSRDCSYKVKIKAGSAGAHKSRVEGTVNLAAPRLRKRAGVSSRVG